MTASGSGVEDGTVTLDDEDKKVLSEKGTSELRPEGWKRTEDISISEEITCQAGEWTPGQEQRQI